MVLGSNLILKAWLFDVAVRLLNSIELPFRKSQQVFTLWVHLNNPVVVHQVGQQDILKVLTPLSFVSKQIKHLELGFEFRLWSFARKVVQYILAWLVRHSTLWTSCY